MIEHLKERVQSLEGKLTESIDFMNSESEQKEIFRKAFEEKQAAFVEYQKNEDKTIQEKVQKELKSFLALTSEKSLQLEKDKVEIDLRLTERTYM